MISAQRVNKHDARTVASEWRPTYQRDELPPLPLIRKMIDTNYIHSIRSDSDAKLCLDSAWKFAIMTYNVLAQSLVRNDHFPHAGRENLKIKNRVLQICREICDMHRPDVACLQEMDRFDLFSPKFTDGGYDCILLKKHTIKGSRMERDHGGHGVATLWQRSKFKLAHRMDIYFDQEVDFDSKREPSCETGNVALVVALERLDSPGKGIIVSNHHLYWKPKAKDERIRQCWVLQWKLRAVMEQFPEWPVILCGDWNTLPTDQLFASLVNGDDLLGTEMPWSRLCPSGAEGAAGQADGASFTTSVGSKESWWGACVDYIMYAEERERRQRVAVTKMLEMPRRELIQPTGIPNAFWPSDHISIVAEVAVLR